MRKKFPTDFTDIHRFYRIIENKFAPCPSEIFIDDNERKFPRIRNGRDVILKTL